MKKLLPLCLFLCSFSVLLAQRKIVEIHAKQRLYKNKIIRNSSAAKPYSTKRSLKNEHLTEVAGRSPHVVDVSASGAATFYLPFALPKGIRAIRPNLGLNYHSQGGDGLAGWGWNIDGLSVISRLEATTFHDAVIDPVDFDEFDRFALDGQRLLLVEGSTYGKDASVYSTERYSNLKIVAHSAVNHEEVESPYAFTVYYPNGAQAYYQSFGGKDWPIARWEDAQGNRIVYQYNTSRGRAHIDKIYYGAQSFSVEDHPNVVEFIYEEVHPRKWEYVGGFSYASDQLLTQIDSYTQGELFRRYVLEHDPTTADYARVKSITEQTSTEKKPPINFYYDPVSNEI